MSQHTRTIAVVLAGGTGQRVGLAIPKQLVKIAGRTILEHTLTIFQDNASVDEILVVMHADYVEEVERSIAAAGLDKVTAVIAGGSTRNETTCRAIDAVTAGLAAGEPDPKLLFHDAVRPLLSQRVIDDCVRALDFHEAVDVAIPSADTIIVTRTHGDDGEFITDIPVRSRLRRGQTPQGFLLSTIRRAYSLAADDPNFEATDDCSVVLRYLPDVPIHVVEGEEHNMKVTHPVDIFIADKFFQLAHQAAPAHGDEASYRAALAGKSLVVFGASYGIGADVADFAESYGATVFRFSRSGTGTFVEDPAHVEKALAEAYASAGRIDYIVNTAGVLHTGKLAETDIDTIENATLVNYLAPVHIARVGHPYLAKTGGQLLLFTSSSYTRGRAGYSLYSSAKAATVNLTQALADEWAADGIRVNCVNPERTRTPMRTKAFGQEPESSLLTSQSVARTSVDVLISGLTGHVIDVRRQDPFQTVVVPEGDLAAAFAKTGDEI